MRNAAFVFVLFVAALGFAFTLVIGVASFAFDAFEIFGAVLTWLGVLGTYSVALAALLLGWKGRRGE